VLPTAARVCGGGHSGGRIPREPRRSWRPPPTHTHTFLLLIGFSHICSHIRVTSLVTSPATRHAGRVCGANCGHPEGVCCSPSAAQHSARNPVLPSGVGSSSRPERRGAWVATATTGQRPRMPTLGPGIEPPPAPIRAATVLQHHPRLPDVPWEWSEHRTGFASESGRVAAAVASESGRQNCQPWPSRVREPQRLPRAGPESRHREGASAAERCNRCRGDRRHLHRHRWGPWTRSQAAV
jgi:hypothetical protein